MTMELRVERRHFTPYSTIGKLFVNGEFHCYTLEPPWRTDDVKPRAVPEGTFRLINRWSNAHQRMLPGLLDVPGFSDVEIHPGNFGKEHVGADGKLHPPDTKACLCVGLSYDPTKPDFIGESQLAFHDLYETLRQAWDKNEPVSITYVNGAQ